MSVRKEAGPVLIHMKAKVIIAVTVMILGLAATIHYLQEAITSAPATGIASKQPAPLPSRCAEKEALSLLLMEEDEIIWSKTNVEALAIPGGTVISNGRHKGEQGLPLATLVSHGDGIRTLEVLPCYGEPLRYTVEELDKEPQRYVLAVNQKGLIKLMDLREKGGEPVTRKPLLKNIHAVRLLP
ncbi:MAG: hypothetical protein R8K46_10875 [Mariprofundaceae bacterium]